MTLSEKDEHIIGIELKLDQALGRFADIEESDCQVFNSELVRYANDMLSHLDIPARASLTLLSGEKLAVNSYQVFIDGQKCRLPVPSTSSPGITAHELARSVAKGLCLNRELFITRQLAKKIKVSWASEISAYHSVPDEKFYSYLTALVRLGLATAKGKKETVEGGRMLKASPELDSISLKFFLGRLQYDMMCGQGNRIVSRVDDRSLEGMCEFMQDGLYTELGVLLPKVSIEIDDSLEGNDFRIQLNDVLYPPIRGLENDEFLANATSGRIFELKLEGRIITSPDHGQENVILKDAGDVLERCRRDNLFLWGPAGFMILNMAVMVRRNASMFLTEESVGYSMEQLRNIFWVLADAASKRFNIAMLTGILRELLDEQLSIRDLRNILEALLAVSGAARIDHWKLFMATPGATRLCPVKEGKAMEDLSSEDYSNYLRTAMKRYISYKYTRGGSTLYVYMLNPEIEKRIRDADSLPLSDDEHDRLIKAIYSAVNTGAVTNPVIIAPLDIRKKLRSLIRTEFPLLSVLSFHELVPDLRIQSAGKVAW